MLALCLSGAGRCGFRVAMPEEALMTSGSAVVLEGTSSKDGRDGTRRLFEKFGRLLRTRGLPAQEGSIVDASFVAAPRQRNNGKRTKRSSNLKVVVMARRCQLFGIGVASNVTLS